MWHVDLYHRDCRSYCDDSHCYFMLPESVCYSQKVRANYDEISYPCYEFISEAETEMKIILPKSE